MKEQKRIVWIIFPALFALIMNGCAGSKSDRSPASSPNGFQSDKTARPIESKAAEIATDFTALYGESETSGDLIGGTEELRASAPQAEATAENKEVTAPLDAKGKIIQHPVSRGDTLMKLAFQYLGDFRRWREIARLNESLLGNSTELNPGMTLQIELSNVKSVTKNGDPYAIKRGDSLSKISGWVYGTINRWKEIWKNNPELILNPNKIYAGFTLYYVKDSNTQRNPSSTQTPTEPVQK